MSVINKYVNVHSIHMAEITKLTAANTTRSLRTTVPTRIVQALNLNANSYLKWSATTQDGKIVINVEPIIG